MDMISVLLTWKEFEDTTTGTSMFAYLKTPFYDEDENEKSVKRYFILIEREDKIEMVKERTIRIIKYNDKKEEMRRFIMDSDMIAFFIVE